MTKFEVTAHFRQATNGVRMSPAFLTVTAEVDTEEQAIRIATEFPKSVGLKGMGIRRADGYGSRWCGYLRLTVNLFANDANGGVNEVGLRRYRTFRKHAARLGHEVIWATDHSINHYPTEKSFEDAIA